MADKDKEIVEKARDRLVCIITNTPEKFVEGIIQISIKRMVGIWANRGVVPMGSQRYSELDYTGEEIDKLCRFIRSREGG